MKDQVPGDVGNKTKGDWARVERTELEKGMFDLQKVLGNSDMRRKITIFFVCSRQLVYFSSILYEDDRSYLRSAKRK